MTIHLSDAAQAQIIKLACESDIGLGIRLTVVSGGCSGFQYKFTKADLVREDEDKDVIVGAAGAALMVSHEDAARIEGATIDYVKDIMSEKFTVNNPNSACCGCGESFT